jgi:hypothetical protein
MFTSNINNLQLNVKKICQMAQARSGATELAATAGDHLAGQPQG